MKGGVTSNSFTSWLALNTAASEGRGPASRLTEEDWSSLWRDRPPIPGVVKSVGTVNDLATTTLADEFLGTVAELHRRPLRTLAGLTPSLTLVDSPGLLMYRTRHDDLRVMVEEGLVRFIYTIASLGIYPLLKPPTPSSASADKSFLTGAYSALVDDDERVARTLMAYCGAIYGTTGNYLPLVVGHNAGTALIAEWVTVGALALAMFHELSHYIIETEIFERPTSTLAKLLTEHNAYRELYCDSTAAFICAIAFLHVEQPWPSVAISGAALLPRLIGLLDDFRFVIPPSSHPSAEDRSEAVRNALQKILPESAVTEAYGLQEDAYSFAKVHQVISDLTSMQWHPREAHHLANALDPHGPIQFMLSDGSGGIVEPVSEVAFMRCSRAIDVAEEALRRRTLLAFHQFTEIGAALCAGWSPLELVDERLAERALRSFGERHGKLQHSQSPSEEYSEKSIRIAAMIGQQYFWTEFIPAVAPDLIAEAELRHVHGVTYDDVARHSEGLPPDVVLSATAIFERGRRGEKVGFAMDRTIAAELLEAVRSAMTTESDKAIAVADPQDSE